MNNSSNIRGRGFCPSDLSETQRSFGPPYKHKQPITRANRMEQFLWQEIFAEYNRQNSMPEVWEPNQTEYFEEFCKDVPPEDADRKEVAINKHPLYCTTAITVWNPDGDATRTFKKIYSMTGPREQCSEKFAP